MLTKENCPEIKVNFLFVCHFMHKSTLFIVQAVLALALLGIVSAELSCEDCSFIGTSVSEWASSDGMVYYTVDEILLIPPNAKHIQFSVV